VTLQTASAACALGPIEASKAATMSSAILIVVEVAGVSRFRRPSAQTHPAGRSGR
jgi:hypothetical protein